VASSAKKKKEKKKRRRRPGGGTGTGTGTGQPPASGPTTATLSGHSNWNYAHVYLQHLSGGGWVDTPGGYTLSNGSGDYGHTVAAGFTYRYYVYAMYYFPMTFGGVIIQCRQRWADTSPYANAQAGRSYTGMDAFLQPSGPAGC
jgi:hypothetical protein